MKNGRIALKLQNLLWGNQLKLRCDTEQYEKNFLFISSVTFRNPYSLKNN